MITNILVFVIIALSLSLWFIDHDGLIAVDWLNYKINVSVSFAIYVLLIFLFLLIIFLKFFLILGHYIKNYELKQKLKDLKALCEGYSYLIIDDIENTRNTIIKINKKTSNDILSLLLKCRLYFLLKQYEEAKKYFIKISNLRIKIEQSFGLWLFARIKDERNYDKQKEILESLNEIFIEQKWSIIFRIELLLRKKLWQDAIKEVKLAVNSKINLPYDSQKVISICYYAMALQEFNSDNYLKALKILKFLSWEQQKLFFIVMLKAKLYTRINKKGKAIDLLKKQYSSDPHPDIANLYLTLVKDYSSAIKILYDLSPNYYYSIFLVAKENLLSGRYDIVIRNLVDVLNKHKYVSIYCLILFAKFLLHNYEDFPMWLEKIQLESLSDPVWSCASCKHRFLAWNYECEFCRGFNTIMWS